MIEFTRYADGTCALCDGDELVWSSDNDEEFFEEFDAQIEPEDIDSVIEWLEEAGYLAGGESVDIVDEGDEPMHEDDEDDEDEEGEPWQH